MAQKRLWEKISDKGLKLYLWFTLIVLIAAILGISLSNKFHSGVKAVLIIGLIFVAAISFFMYMLWHKYFYQKFFKGSMQKLEQKAARPKDTDKRPSKLYWTIGGILGIIIFITLNLINFASIIGTQGKSAIYDTTVIFSKIFTPFLGAIILFIVLPFLVGASIGLIIRSIVHRK